MKELPEGHPDRYDWDHATRGTLARRAAAERTNLRALDDDLAAAFPDSEAVNVALRAVLALRGALEPSKAPARPPKRAKKPRKHAA